jgi:hypothetical protein
MQAKLAVGAPGDALEREADDASQQVVAGKPVQRISRLSAEEHSGEPITGAMPVQRQCPACAEEQPKGGVQRKCATCAQTEREQIRREAGPSSTGAAPAGQSTSPAGGDGGLDTARAEREMTRAGSGSPLSPSTRADMEQHFGTDFSGVRVHRGEPANEANRALSARAFTHGSDIFLGGDASPADRGLMAHELTHVVQQSPANPATVQRQAAAGDDPEQAAALAEEIEAAEQSARFAGTAEDRGYFVRLTLLLKDVHKPLKTQNDLNAFLNEAKSAAEQEWETLEDLDDNAFAAIQANPGAVASASSPSEAALKSNPEAFPIVWAGRIRKALGLGADKDALAADLQQALNTLQGMAKGLPEAILANGLPVSLADKDRLPTFRLRRQDAQSSGAVAEFARAAIRYSQIRSVAMFAAAWQRGLDETVKEVENGSLVPDYDDWKNFVDKKQPQLRLLPKRAHDQLATSDEEAQQFDTDMDGIVDAAGPLVAVSLLSGLLYGSFDGWDFGAHSFAEQLGVANEVVAGASGDGRVSQLPLYVALHTAMSLVPGAGIFGDSDNLGRLALALTWAWENGYFGAAAAEAFADLMSHIVTFVLETVAFLAAQEVPILDIIVDLIAGEQILEQIDQFLSAYNAAAGATRVGPLQHAGARLAELLASTAVQVAAGAAVSAGFHGVDPVGRVRKRLGEVGDVEPGVIKGKGEPAKAPAGLRGHATDAAKGVLEEDALAKKPVDGHEVVATEEGVGICSPDPCPVIGVEYAQELADHPDLKEWNDQVQELRKTDPARAVDEASRLVRAAEAARANAARAARAAGEEPIFTLGVGKDRMERIRTGERDFVIDRRLTFDIDEVLPVGQKGIKRQRAVDRALSAENRQLLDPNTNRATKGLGIDPRELPGKRALRDPVSVTADPHALLTRRFSEVHELQRIFDRAVESVKNKGELTPTELKARINRETRRIITEDGGADAVAVRQALNDIGFEHEPNIGWVMKTGPAAPAPTPQVTPP